MATTNEHVWASDEWASEEENDDDDDESGSDMEFGEFDLTGARNLPYQQTVAGYEDDDDDADGCGERNLQDQRTVTGYEEDDDVTGYEDDDDADGCGERNLQDQRTVTGYEEDDDDADGCGAQFSVRPYHGGGAIAGEMGNLQLSGFEARSDGPDLTDQHELTSYDMRRLVHLALEGGESESMEDDEAYQRALACGTPVSPVARDAIVGQALQQSAYQQQQQSKPPSEIFPMRTGY